MTHIVKRRGHKQVFDDRKLYASVYAACLSSHTQKEESEATADLVTREIKKWLGDKEEVGSGDLFKQVGEELKRLNKEAAFMYLTHRDVS